MYCIQRKDAAENIHTGRETRTLQTVVFQSEVGCNQRIGAFASICTRHILYANAETKETDVGEGDCYKEAYNLRCGAISRDQSPRQESQTQASDAFHAKAITTSRLFICEEQISSPHCMNAFISHQNSFRSRNYSTPWDCPQS